MIRKELPEAQVQEVVKRVGEVRLWRFESPGPAVRSAYHCLSLAINSRMAHTILEIYGPLEGACDSRAERRSMPRAKDVI